MTGNPRADLVQRLDYMHTLLQAINGLWQQKAATAHRYQPMVALKGKWGLKQYALSVGALTVGLPIFGTVVFQLMGTLADPIGFLPLAFPLALVLSVLAVLLWNKVFLPRQHAQAHSTNQQRHEANRAVRSQEEQIDAQIARAGQDYAVHVGEDFFPQDYLYEEAVVFCIQMVRNHRANTVGEAINLYAQELERRRAENMQAAMLAEQQRATRMQMYGNVINAVGHGATARAVREEGRANRAANAANAERISDAVKEPKTVYVKKGWSIW